MVNGDEIRRRREALSLSMLEAAKRAGFNTAQQWNGIENSRGTDVRASTLAAVARALGCRMEDLLIEDAPKGKPKRRK